MYKSFFHPNITVGQESSLQRHFSGDKMFELHPVSPETRKLMIIEDGDFKSLAERDGILS
jgi:hypothetical protein